MSMHYYFFFPSQRGSWLSLIFWHVVVDPAQPSTIHLLPLPSTFSLDLLWQFKDLKSALIHQDCTFGDK